MIKRLIMSALVLSVLLVIAIAAALHFGDQWLNTPMNKPFEFGDWVQSSISDIKPKDTTGEFIELTVNQGQTLSGVASILQQQGLMPYPKIWVLFARYKNTAHLLKAGHYKLETKLSPAALLEKLVEGDVVVRQLTVIEGSRFVDALKVVREHPALQASITTLSPQLIADELGVDSFSELEGLFYPDTYHFAEGASDREILAISMAKMQKVLAEEWALREEGLPYETAAEALIMASIVERETGSDKEREQIAGVFVRRLKIGMRLQTDPTVIYGLGDQYKGNLSRKDLRTDTPYNTYTRKGLPPTPIALPGRASIAAALHPDDGKALYFVAKGDGSHYFSATFAEHEKAVHEYQIRNRVKNYRSAPQ